MIGMMIAAAAVSHPDGSLTPTGFSIILTAIGGFVGVLGTFAAIMLGNKIRGVRMAPGSEITTSEHPPTRREFDKLEAKVETTLAGEFLRLEAKVETTLAVFSTRMDEGFIRMQCSMADSSKNTDKRITNQNDRLTRKIEEIASGAYQARNKIHVNVNDLAQRMARQEERSDIADVFEKTLAAVAASSQVKVQPVHQVHS